MTLKTIATLALTLVISNSDSCWGPKNHELIEIPPLHYVVKEDGGSYCITGNLLEGERCENKTICYRGTDEMHYRAQD